VASAPMSCFVVMTGLQLAVEGQWLAACAALGSCSDECPCTLNRGFCRVLPGPWVGEEWLLGTAACRSCTIVPTLVCEQCKCSSREG
jgi:hypothetical protein